MTIHPTAIVDAKTVLGQNVTIGPYCVVGPDVTLADNVSLISHVSLAGHTTIGAQTTIFPFSSIGHPPQDLKYKGEPSQIIIGKTCTIREYVTINPGTAGGIMKTGIGDECLLMVSVHVAHDCILGDHVILANNVTLGGHVEIAAHVIIGGLSAVQQFVRIGAHAMIGGMSGVDKDVIPFGLVMGERATLHGLNLVGLKRHQFTNTGIQSLQQAYAKLFTDHNQTPFLKRLEDLTVSLPHHENSNDELTLVTQLVEFLAADSRCRYCLPKE